MSEENTATPVEASASAEPMTESAADAMFAAAGDGKVAPSEPEKVEAQATAPAPEVKVEPVKKQEPVVSDPLKAAEDRAAQIERERNDKLVADEARRIEEQRRAEKKPDAPAPLDLSAVEKGLLDGDLKDFKIKSVNKNGEVVETPLADFLDDEKGYGEVARGTVSLATAIASKLIEKALAPLQQRLEAYEGEKAKATADAEHDAFMSKVADETAHKDVADIEKSDEFWKWMGEQSKQMQALAASKDIRNIDLLLSAFKSATGYKGAAKAPDRKAVVDRQRAEVARSDKVSRATVSARSGGRGSDGDSEIETTEDAEKIFAEAAKTSRG